MLEENRAQKSNFVFTSDSHTSVSGTAYIMAISRFPLKNANDSTIWNAIRHHVNLEAAFPE